MWRSAEGSAGNALDSVEAASKKVGRAGLRGIAKTLRAVLREDGARGLFRGLSASYLGITENAIQFALYEYIKATYMHWRANPSQDLWSSNRSHWATPNRYSAASREQYTPGVAFCVGASAKLCASLLTYPHEVIRTRLREQRGYTNLRYRGLVHCFQTIFREEGARGLYGGMSMHLIRTVPNAAILFLVVETVTRGDI